MGNIFHHASLTIAATSAVSMTQGFLRRPRCQQIKLLIDSVSSDAVASKSTGFTRKWSATALRRNPQSPQLFDADKRRFGKSG